MMLEVVLYSQKNQKGNVALIESQSVFRHCLKNALKEVVFECAKENDSKSQKIARGQGYPAVGSRRRNCPVFQHYEI